MNKARDLVALAILAFREGQHDAAAKFFTSAMGSDDLDSFVNDITISMPRSARNAAVPDSDNTMSPSLASAAAKSDLVEVVAHLEARFRAECSLFDEGDEEVEVRASLSSDEDEDCEDEDEDDLDDSEYEDEEEEEFESDASSADTQPDDAPVSIIVASAGPVRIK